ncbi:hypothetical protein Tco_0738104 [Tanacetum coccineum]
MHTSKDDYLINTLRFVSLKEETQIYDAILPESLTSLEMKETKAYKTYLGFATGATPPKKARKSKKPTSPKLTTVPVSTEEPTGKSKRVKRPAKKSTKALARGVVIRETHEIPLSKKKEKTHPSGSGNVTKTALSAVKIIPSVTSEGTGVKPGVPDVTEEESSEKNEEDKDDEEEVKDKIFKTPSNDSDNEDETKITDKAEVDTDKGFVQKEGTNAAMTNIQQGNENLKIIQVIEDPHVTLSTVPQKTEVPVTSSSHSSDLAA